MPTDPAPVVVQPSGEFDGNDGPWSSFWMRVGSPPQTLRLLPSTEIPESWFVLSLGCTIEDPANCTDTRGGIYNPTNSTTWDEKSLYSLAAEVNLGYTTNSDNGEYGTDTLAVGQVGDGGVSLPQQVVAGIATKDFYLGNLGLSDRPVNWDNNNDPEPGFLANLRTNNLIPSLSYGYTAGAAYRDVTGSLTLGGFDASRFTPNDVSFTFASDPTRQLVVGLETISYSDSKITDVPLLSTGVMALVDSTVPHIWLPLVACKAFEEAFGITYDETSQYYLVNMTTHMSLLSQNPTLVFQLSNGLDGGPSVNITMPYASFDLEVSSPIVNDTTWYFPLRRANDSSQYTLGRTILQESFLTVDYERSNFSISQCDFETNTPAHIVAIAPGNSTNASPASPTTTTSTVPSSSGSVVIIQQSSHSLSNGAKAGIAIAVVLLALICGVGAFFCVKRRRSRQKKNTSSELEGHLPDPPAEMSGGNAPIRKHGSIKGYYGDIRRSFSQHKTNQRNSVVEVEGDPGTIPEHAYNRRQFENTHRSPHELQAEELRSELSTPEPTPISEMSSPGLVSRGSQRSAFASPVRPGFPRRSPRSSMIDNNNSNPFSSPPLSAQTSPLPSPAFDEKKSELGSPAAVPQQPRIVRRESGIASMMSEAPSPRPDESSYQAIETDTHQ